MCGCLAIIKIFEGDLVWAAYLVGIAAVLDFFDGFAARLLKVSSPIGKDLDSLADLVTFGVVPGMMMLHLINFSYILNLAKLSGADTYSFGSVTTFSLISYFALVIPIFSAIRLAKFNNDTRQSESFIGLPTPANAILICSIPLILNWPFDLYTKGNLTQFIANPNFLIGLCFFQSFLLVAELPLFALKFKHFKFKGNEVRFIFLGFSLLLIILLKLLAIPLIIISYVLFSLVNNLLLKQKVESN